MSDDVVSVPGYPQAFTYEFSPQKVHFPMEMPATAFMAGRKYLYRTEGYISVSTSILEEEVTSAWRDYLSSLGMEVYEVGFISSTIENSKDQGDPEMMKFLDKMQREHGEKSVGCVSIGNTYYPCRTML